MRRHTRTLMVLLLATVLLGALQAPAGEMVRQAPTEVQQSRPWLQKCLCAEEVSLGFFLTLEPADASGGPGESVETDGSDHTADNGTLQSEDDPNLIDGARRVLATVRVFVELSLRILDHILRECSWISGAH